MYPMQVTLTIQTPEQLQTLLASTTGNASALPGVKKEKKKAGAPTPPPAEKQPEAPPVTEKAEAPQAAAAAAAGERTLEDAKALTIKIVSTKGRDAAVALLQKYGVAVAAKLAPEQLDGFCADAQEVLGA